MKEYTVLCVAEKGKMLNVVVNADSENEAKENALEKLKEEGYNNPVVAPELPGQSIVVIETSQYGEKMVENLIRQAENFYPNFDSKVVRGKEILEQLKNYYIGKDRVITTISEFYLVLMGVVGFLSKIDGVCSFEEYKFLCGIVNEEYNQEGYIKFKNGPVAKVDLDFLLLALKDGKHSIEIRTLLFQFIALYFSIDGVVQKEFDFLLKIFNVFGK